MLLDTIFSLLTLTLLEIVLGVDNLIFISIASSRLPKEKQKAARRAGLSIAWITRLLLLASVAWIVTLKKPLFSVIDWTFSVHDLLLIFGGIFLLYKGTVEIHNEFENHKTPIHIKKFANFTSIIFQIGLFDIIFSLDSVLTAIGMTQNFIIMAIAISISILIMMIASEPISKFINHHPSIRVLALSFLLLIGVVLIADGFQQHVSRNYIYFAVCFATFVEVVNSLLIKRAAHLNKGGR